MANKIVTLHPQNNKSDNLYPRVLGQSVQAGANIAIDSTANTISAAQSLIDTINGKQIKGDYATNSTLTNNYYTKLNVDNLLANKQNSGNYALKSEIPTTTSQLTNNSGYLISSDLKPSISIASNSDDTTSLSISVGGNWASVDTGELKVGYAENAHSIVDEQRRQEITFDDINNFLSYKQDKVKKLGNATTPVYVSANGVFSACTDYSNASVKHATSADTAAKATTANSAVRATYARSLGESDSNYTKLTLDNALNAKQNTLVSGNNIKTINGNSILGSGNIAIAGSIAINSIDIVYNDQNVDDGTFYNALTSHKAILGVYYVREETYDSSLYSCIYYCYSGQDPEDTSYRSYRFTIVYYDGRGLVAPPNNATIRIIYID